MTLRDTNSRLIVLVGFIVSKNAVKRSVLPTVLHRYTKRQRHIARDAVAVHVPYMLRLNADKLCCGKGQDVSLQSSYPSCNTHSRSKASVGKSRLGL